MKTLFAYNELPMEDFKKLGLYDNGQLLLEPSDLNAMLSGRRSALIELRELKVQGLDVSRLDARLSLEKNPRGDLELRLHPIYHAAKSHPLLTQKEMDMLVSGEKHILGKRVELEQGRWEMVNYEYDLLCREFVSYRPSSVQAPDRVNSSLLSKEQQQAFQRGEEVSLDEGTTFRFSANAPSGILSNRPALILSIFFDGGISYLLLRALGALDPHKSQLPENTQGFSRAMEQFKGQNSNLNNQKISPDSVQLQPSAQNRTRNIYRSF